MVRNHAYVMMKLRQEQRKEFCLTNYFISLLDKRNIVTINERRL